MSYLYLVDFEPFYPHLHVPAVPQVVPTGTHADLDCRKIPAHLQSKQHTYTSYRKTGNLPIKKTQESIKQCYTVEYNENMAVTSVY